MLLQVGVKVMIKNQGNKFLLLKRDSAKYPGVHSLWDLPGGRIQTGIGLYENLAREVFEETGMRLAPEVEILGAQDLILKDKHVVRITYLGSATGPLVMGEEHIDSGWFTTQEMTTLEGVDDFFSKLLRDKFDRIQEHTRGSKQSEL